MDDMAVYHKNRATLAYGVKINEQQAMVRNMLSNLDHISALTASMHRYIVTKDEKTLGRHGDFFATALDDLRTEFGGTV